MGQRIHFLVTPRKGHADPKRSWADCWGSGCSAFRRFCNCTGRRGAAQSQSQSVFFFFFFFSLSHFHNGAPSSPSLLLSATYQFVMVLEALATASATSSSASPPSTSNSTLPPPPQDAWTLAYQTLLPHWKSLSHSRMVPSSLSLSVLNLILFASRMSILFIHTCLDSLA